MFDYVLVSVGLLWLLIGSIFDIKTFEVPDWLSYSLIVVGLGVRLIYSLALNELSHILYGLIGFGVMFVLGMVMYYGKQWGGGDCKLIMGIGALYGTGPSFVALEWPFLLVLLINILIIGGMYGVIWSLVLMVFNFDKFKKEFVKSCLELKIALGLILVLIVLGLIFGMFVYSLLFGVMLLVGVLVLKVIRVVEKVCMIKKVSVSTLVEGDWVAEDVKVKGRVVCRVKDLGLTKEQIVVLKKNFKEVLVRSGIPFVPAFFIALIITLVVGNLFRVVMGI